MHILYLAFGRAFVYKTWEKNCLKKCSGSWISLKWWGLTESNLVFSTECCSHILSVPKQLILLDFRKKFLMCPPKFSLICCLCNRRELVQTIVFLQFKLCLVLFFSVILCGELGWDTGWRFLCIPALIGQSFHQACENHWTWICVYHFLPVLPHSRDAFSFCYPGVSLFLLLPVKGLRREYRF